MGIGRVLLILMLVIFLVIIGYLFLVFRSKSSSYLSSVQNNPPKMTTDTPAAPVTPSSSPELIRAAQEADYLKKCNTTVQKTGMPGSMIICKKLLKEAISDGKFK